MINIGKRGFLHYLSTIALIVMVSLAGIVLFVVEAANQDNLLVSTPTHVEAYDLSVNGTLIMYPDGTQVCNGTTNGSLYYDGTDHYACDGSSWTSITQAGAADGYCDGQSCNVTNTGTLDGYQGADLLDNTDSQTLTWNDNNDTLYISGGNWVNLTNLSGGVGTDDQTLTWNDATNILSIESGNSVNLSNLTGGSSDHGSLTGLTDDDHPQYMNQARFDSNTSGWDTDAGDDFNGAYTSLTGRPAGLDDGDNDTTYSHLSNFTDDLGHVEDNTSWNESYADTKYSTGAHFDGLYESLTGAVPTHLSNFTDNLGHVEESTTAGTGLDLATYQLSILLAYRLPQSCANGQIAEYNTTSGGWDCATDDQAASGMSNWVLAASGTGGSETITEGETVTFDVGGSGYLTANRSTNTIYYNFNTTKLDANYVGQTEYPNLDTDSTDDLTLTQVNDSIGNWSQDKGDYTTGAHTNDADILAFGYNHTTDLTSYYDGRYSTGAHYTTSDFNTDFATKTTDNLAEGTANLYDNQSWNESHADSKYSTGAHTTNTWQNYVWNFDSDTASPTAVTNATTIDWAGAGTVSTSHTGNTITITGTAHLTLSAVAANVGNWSADKSGYYTSTQVDTLGNWSADSSSYSTTSQANDLYADDGANTDITSMTGLTGEVKTSSYTNYTAADANVQYFSQGCVMKSNSTGIYFIC